MKEALFGECTQHPGNNMINCPMCSMENAMKITPTNPPNPPDPVPEPPKAQASQEVLAEKEILTIPLWLRAPTNLDSRVACMHWAEALAENLGTKIPGLIHNQFWVMPIFIRLLEKIEDLEQEVKKLKESR